jgi:hypothetical protein
MTVLRPWLDEEVVVGEMKVGVVGGGRDQELKRNLAPYCGIRRPGPLKLAPTSGLVEVDDLPPPPRWPAKPRYVFDTLRRPLSNSGPISERTLGGVIAPPT